MVKGKAQHLLSDMFLDLISSHSTTQDFKVLFREESEAICLFRAFFNHHAPTYINHCVDSLLSSVNALDKALEIDPRTVPANEVANNAKKLISIAQSFVEHLCESASKCPHPVRRILRIVGEEVRERFPEMRLQAIANLLFLRFITPAILSTQNYRKPSSQRTLTLMVKMVNNLMNNITFGEKESFMVSLNSFISSENLSKVEGFVEELLSEEHIVNAAVENSLDGSNSSSLTRKPEGKVFKHYRLMSALDELKRALIENMPALFTAAQSKPKLQQMLQQLVLVFLCELPTEM